MGTSWTSMDANSIGVRLADPSDTDDPVWTEEPGTAPVLVLESHDDALEITGTTDELHALATRIHRTLPTPATGPAEARTHYAAATAAAWLRSRDPNSSVDNPATVAEHLGIDDHWPGGYSDDAISNIIALADAALDADVIRLAPPIDNVDFLRTTEAHGVLSGFRIAVTTQHGITIVGDALWADDLTTHDTGHPAATTTLDEVAAHIDHLIGAYRDAHGS